MPDDEEETLAKLEVGTPAHLSDLSFAVYDGPDGAMIVTAEWKLNGSMHRFALGSGTAKNLAHELLSTIARAENQLKN